jgi:hypothetical protein
MRKWLIVALTLAWLAWELIAAFDGSDATWPLTQIVTTYVPWWLAMPGAVALAVWIVPHFVANYRKGGTMKFKFEPVVWLTTVAAVLGAALEVDAQYHVLPAGWGHWVAAAAGFVALLVTAVKARGAVTPLAAPQVDEDTPLVPKAMR